jgi:hypothetical protein
LYSQLTEISVELDILREELAAEKQRRIDAELKLKSLGNDNTGAVIVGGAADGSVPVASCRHQKLEFLRFQEGPDGKELKCPFTPTNYENWEKLPPLCDYISLEVGLPAVRVVACAQDVLCGLVWHSAWARAI